MITVMIAVMMITVMIAVMMIAVLIAVMNGFMSDDWIHE
jgi:hypothetical protein